MFFEAAKLIKSEAEPGRGWGGGVAGSGAQARPPNASGISWPGQSCKGRTQTSVSMPSCLSTSRPPSLLWALDMASQCPLPTLAVPRAGILTEGMGPLQRAENESMCESPQWGPQPPKPSGPSRSIEATGNQVWLARPVLGFRTLSLKPWVWDWRIGSPSMNCSWAMIQPELQHGLPGIIPE